MDTSQRVDSHINRPSQNQQLPLQDRDFFAFLKADPPRSPSFFSEKGLAQDIIQVTNAEPDVCLEAFYALYNTLWPHLEKQSDISLENAWGGFIGGAAVRGILCPPEKLLTERRVREIKNLFSNQGGETKIFQYLDHVIRSISNLKQTIEGHPDQILQKEEILASLTLASQFYQQFRNRTITLIQAIIEKEQIKAPSAFESDALEDHLEPKAIMMSDIFDGHWAYRIPRNKAEKILSLDTHGRNLQSNLNDPSSHRVRGLPENVAEPIVFFKANGNTPIQPEKEFMVFSLYRHLQIPVPETALLILTDVFEKNPEYFYAVQASEAVIGESPSKACQDPEIIFDHGAYVSQAIGALLTNPSDGSFNNFKYNAKYKTFISIDNDLVFKPEIAYSGNERVINIKSMLYLLPQIDHQISKSAKTLLMTTLDPHLIILSWLKDLSQKNKEYKVLFSKLPFQKTRSIYQNLFSQEELPKLTPILQQKVFIDPEIHQETFFPQISVSKDLLSTLVDKQQKIQKILLAGDLVSTQDLLNEVFPLAGKYYHKLRLKFNDPEIALEALWGERRDSVDYSKLSSILNPEEINGLNSSDDSSSQNQIQEAPETFFKEYKSLLASKDNIPLDRFIQRHSQRKRENLLNLPEALGELPFLIREELIDSHHPRDIVDFCHNLSKMTGSEAHLTKDIISLLSNLPHPEIKWLLTLETHFFRIDRPFPKDLVPFSLMVNGAFMKQKRFALTESDRQYLFDQQGNINKHSSLTGRLNVTCFPESKPEFYLKQNPEWPGYEFASTLFMRLLGVTQLPYQDLLIINDYPVLLSQKVSGSPVLHIWKDPRAFRNLDPFHTGLLIISAMLINPEDGKEDNFILTSDGRYLIPIDSDHCFLPSFFQKEGNFWNLFTVNTALQTKTILFSLEEMEKPIDPRVKNHILSKEFDKLFSTWLTELVKLENKFDNLVDQNQRKIFLEQGAIMGIPFYLQFIYNLHWKAYKIQDLLKTKPQVTPFELLKAVEPFAAKCYQSSFKKGWTLESRFKAATDQLYQKTAVDGSRVSVLNTRTMMDIVHISKEELQKDAAFRKMGPADALELLKQLSQEHTEKIKTEQKFLDELDAKNLETLWVSLFGNSPVEAGLKEFLANPKAGLAFKGSKLITSSKLTELFTQFPDKGVRIRFLSLPESPLLTDKEITILTEECPNLEYLDVSGCVKLKQIVTVEGDWPLLARLEAKDCKNLKKFISYSPLRILRIETARKIEVFIKELTFDIFLISNKADGFEFSFRKAENFEIRSWGRTVSHGDFIKAMLSKKEEDEEIFTNFKTRIGEHLISAGKGLEIFITDLSLTFSKPQARDIKKMSLLRLQNLKSLNLSFNQIYNEGLEALSKGSWTRLETLNLTKTGITTKGVEVLVAKTTHWAQLKHLNLSQNDEIDDEILDLLAQANWPLLETLDLKYTKVTKKASLNFIFMINFPNFKYIDVDWRQSMFQRHSLLAEELDLRNGNLSKKEMELIVKNANWPQLKYLDLSYSKIEDEGLEILSQGGWFLLEKIYLSQINISSKGVKILLTKFKLTHLRHLDLSKNQIDDDGLEILAQGTLPLLEALNLTLTEVTKKGLLNFVLKINWPSLKEIKSDWIKNGNYKSFIEKLDLSESKITENDVELILTNWKRLPLKHLNLSNSEISLEGISVLILKCPFLEELDIENTKLTSKGVEKIIKQSKWTQLRHLNASRNEISDEGVFALAQADWPLLKNLNLSSTKLSLQRIQTNVHQPKWSQLLRHLDISNNELLDEGLKVLASKEWPLLEDLYLKNVKISSEGIGILVNKMNLPNLQTLDISENEIFDKGLETLTSGNWPLFKRLICCNTKITVNGNIAFLKSLNWPDFSYLEHSIEESFFNFNEKSKKWSPSKNITALLPGPYSFQDSLTIKIVFDINWLNSQEIYLSISHNNKTVEARMLPRDKWKELGHLELSFDNFSDFEFSQSIAWPPSLKLLDVYKYKLSDENKLEMLLIHKCPLLEELSLRDSDITVRGIEVLVNKSDWPNLKRLDLSNNMIFNEGLELLASGKWPLLEKLRVYNSYLVLGNLETFVDQGAWPNLRIFNPLKDTRHSSKITIQKMFSKKWPKIQLEI